MYICITCISINIIDYLDISIVFFKFSFNYIIDCSMSIKNLQKTMSQE